MRRAVRAIIIKDGSLLVMHRNKFGEEYDTLPGGNVELHETPEQSLMREVEEETMVQYSDPRLVFSEHPGLPWGDQYIYLCTYVSGEPTLKPGSEEDTISRMGKNLYQPLWRPLNELTNMPFRSEALKRAILSAVQTGAWPEKPMQIIG